MPQRKNGPNAGPTFGIVWDKLVLHKPVRYRGTATGAKTNAYRANQRYKDKKFRSFTKNNKVYIERTK
jgi:hypothetical protein